jgi:integrase
MQVYLQAPKKIAAWLLKRQLPSNPDDRRTTRKTITLVVTLCDTKNKTNRTFVINNEQWLLVIRKYYETQKRFFLFYGNNKCSRQPVGVNTFGNMPRKIVEFLQLPNPQSYTGHSFRRSSATLLAGKGVNFLGIKRLGGWKSSATAEGYI